MKRKSSPIPSVIGCLIIQLCVGIIYLWSVYREAITVSFNWDLKAAAMVASYMLLAFCVGNLAGGVLNDRKGPRFTATAGIVLFALGVGTTGLLTRETIGLINVTYCLAGGLGSGIAYAACISCIQKWLPHKRGLASGLAVSAFGLSTVVFSPLSKWLMNVFTDSASGMVNFGPVFFILAGVFMLLGLVACAALVRRPDEEYLRSLPADTGGRVVSSGRSYSLGQAARTVPFWAVFLGIFFINGTWNLTVPLISGLGQARGLTEAQAVFAVSVTGIANAAGRLGMAALSDKIGRTAALMLLAAITFAGAILMTFVGGNAYIAVVVVVAFAYGGPAAVNPAVSTDFFGPKRSGTNYGIIMLALGLSSVCFNFISNNILNSEVIPTFMMAAATAVVSVAVYAVIWHFIRRMRAENALAQERPGAVVPLPPQRVSQRPAI